MIMDMFLISILQRSLKLDMVHQKHLLILFGTLLMALKHILYLNQRIMLNIMN